MLAYCIGPALKQCSTNCRTSNVVKQMAYILVFEMSRNIFIVILEHDLCLIEQLYVRSSA